jgi:hypothetical protein
MTLGYVIINHTKKYLLLNFGLFTINSIAEQTWYQTYLDFSKDNSVPYVPIGLCDLHTVHAKPGAALCWSAKCLHLQRMGWAPLRGT